MAQAKTLTDRLFARIKDNPIIASVIVIGSAVIALATFTGAVSDLLNLFENSQTQTARRELSQLSLDYTADAFVTAAERNDLHAVKLFLAAGMNPNIKNKLDSTALIEAVRGGHTDIVKELVKHRIGFDEFELRMAAIRESGEILRVLLDSGAKLSEKNEAFLFAASSGRFENMRTLLNDGVDLESIRAAALRKAAAGNRANDQEQRKIVRFLLDLGADPNAPDEIGLSALHYAARSGFVAVTQVLLNHGAKVNAKSNGGRTPLFDALYMNNFYPPDRNSESIVEILLSKGADVNVKDSAGKTPLMLAANFRTAKTVKRLLDAGANAADQDNRGRTAASFVKFNVRENHREEQQKIIRLLKFRESQAAAVTDIP